MNKKQYWAMEQQDRIEYNQLSEKLGYSLQSLPMICVFLIFIGFIYIMALLFSANGMDDAARSLHSSLSKIAQPMGILLSFMLCYDIFMILRLYLERRKMENIFLKRNGLK